MRGWPAGESVARRGEGSAGGASDQAGSWGSRGSNGDRPLSTIGWNEHHEPSTLIGPAVPASGVTLQVPSEYPTIQAGIDAAIPGDTVLVADGIYSGDGNNYLNFLGKDIVCRSENGPARTIIDAYPEQGFVLANGETEASVIEGFTITRGDTDSWGAGILLASSATLANHTLSAS